MAQFARHESFRPTGTRTPLRDSFNAVHDFLKAGVSDLTPSLPKGIEHKIKEGIARGLVQVQSRKNTKICVSTNDRDLISKTIFEQINAKTAPTFHNRVPQHLFKILHNSYKELCLKLVKQQNDLPQHDVGIASINEIVPQTPLQSPLEETDSILSEDYNYDTDHIADDHYFKVETKLDVQACKFKTQLQEVEHERKAIRRQLREKARKIKYKIQDVELQCKAAEKKRDDTLKAMEVRRSEQDRIGDYGSEYIGYNVFESTHYCFARQEDTARYSSLKIQDQAVVNRLFNMTAKVLMRKVREAVMQKTELVGGEKFPSITCFLGAQLLDSGNVRLWANSTDDYDFSNFKTDAFDGLSGMPPWDQAIFGSFTSHLTEPYNTYSVEVKDVTAEVVKLQDRKGKAAVITKLVTQNSTAIPSLHLDIFKDVRVSRNTTHDNTEALVLDLSSAATAKEVVRQGLLWEGRTHLCKAFDVTNLDRCGYCQEYGHYATICTSLPRCGNCADQHSTKVCRSSYIKCVLCEEPHRDCSGQCQGKKARRVDMLNARFPSEYCLSPSVVPPREGEGAIPTLNPPKTDLSAPQIEQSDTMKEVPSNSGAKPAQSTFSFALTPSAQQLQDKFPAIEAALEFDMSIQETGTCSKLTVQKD